MAARCPTASRYGVKERLVADPCLPPEAASVTADLTAGRSH